MIRKAILQVVIGVALIAAILTTYKYAGSLKSISDDEIDAQISGISVLMNAQYPEILAHFPDQTASIRKEAKRLLGMQRRGNFVSGANLELFTREIMTPIYWEIKHAPDEFLDSSLDRVLKSYSVLEGTPACGAFLMNGTIVIPIPQRQELWNSQAGDTTQHFETILQGIKNPQQHPPATAETWTELNSRYLANGHPQSHIDTFFNAFGEGTTREGVDGNELCTAFLGLGQSLVGAQFPGFAAIKADLIIKSFGVPAK